MNNKKKKEGKKSDKTLCTQRNGNEIYDISLTNYGQRVYDKEKVVPINI